MLKSFKCRNLYNRYLVHDLQLFAENYTAFLCPISENVYIIFMEWLVMD
jgi:hypothetical protein